MKDYEKKTNMNIKTISKVNDKELVNNFKQKYKKFIINQLINKRD